MNRHLKKTFDNLTIGITDMQGNVYHEEVTSVPACTYSVERKMYPVILNK